MGEDARWWMGAHASALLAAALIAGAAGVRVALAAAGWPGTDSDDATMGLMAKHILARGEHPIFFYGQAYMGSIEAYVGALMFRLLGVSIFALKCGLIALYACFMAVMYALLAHAFNRLWAVIGMALLALGADEMLYHQLEAYGGYLETLLFGAAMTALAGWLVGSAGDLARRGWRPWAFAGWGLAAGLGMWSDPLVAPFVAFSAVALLTTCWREVRGWLGALALAGLLVGASPWIVYDVTVGTADAAKSFLQHQPQTSQTAAPAAPASSAAGPGPLQALGEQALGTVLIGIPNNTGATTLCPLTSDEAWPPDRWMAPHTQGCMALRAAWGVSFLGLLGTAIALEWRACWPLVRKRPRAWSRADRQRTGRGVARLVGLLAPAATILLFALSSAATSSPWIFSRYMISVLIAVPVMLAVLWEHLPRVAFPWLGRVYVARAGLAALTGFLVLALLLGVVGTFRAVPAQQARNQVQDDLVAALLAHGDTRVYTEFWTCYHLAFRTDERVVCSVLNKDLTLRASRYAPYDALVRAAPAPAYVFPIPSDHADAFMRLARQQGQGWHYDTTMVDGQYIIIHPAPGTRLGVPVPMPVPVSAAARSG